MAPHRRESLIKGPTTRQRQYGWPQRTCNFTSSLDIKHVSNFYTRHGNLSYRKSGDPEK